MSKMFECLRRRKFPKKRTAIISSMSLKGHTAKNRLKTSSNHAIKWIRVQIRINYSHDKKKQMNKVKKVAAQQKRDRIISVNVWFLLTSKMHNIILRSQTLMLLFLPMHIRSTRFFYQNDKYWRSIWLEKWFCLRYNAWDKHIKKRRNQNNAIEYYCMSIFIAIKEHALAVNLVIPNSLKRTPYKHA